MMVSLYLGIARKQLETLNNLDGPIIIGDDDSTHVEHAIISSVFSAFAVEHAITELIWVRCFFQTPNPQRRITVTHASKLRNLYERLEFIKDTTEISEEVLTEIKELFEYRNSIAHCRPFTHEGKVLSFEAVEAINSAGRGEELDEANRLMLEDKPDYSQFQELANEFGTDKDSLRFRGIGTPDIEAAYKNFRFAERIVEELLRERESADWPIVERDIGI